MNPVTRLYQNVVRQGKRAWEWSVKGISYLTRDPRELINTFTNLVIRINHQRKISEQFQNQAVSITHSVELDKVLLPQLVRLLWTVSVSGITGDSFRVTPEKDTSAREFEALIKRDEELFRQRKADMQASKEVIGQYVSEFKKATTTEEIRAIIEKLMNLRIGTVSSTGHITFDFTMLTAFIRQVFESACYLINKTCLPGSRELGRQILSDIMPFLRVRTWNRIGKQYVKKGKVLSRVFKQRGWNAEDQAAAYATAKPLMKK
ncbi:MAG: hypothetical protein KKF46_00515 [Nanoarchaeota archaeon]|nr:hypothetical protein [Nanoarchaeota archaeon]MBU1320817.1 hypothetical protein [Nanoarchaeota archaeon]MBU1596827.1 hypothetical protein [Nanoarchaeota archaeon]MBU2440895.1 hypothetical protein [Nanoarchaeota archaeon]